MSDTHPQSGPVNPTDIEIPVAANTGAVGAIGLELNEGKEIPRKQIISWAMWDWATQPFNTVILTFVFVALYLIGDDFLAPSIAALDDSDPLKQRALADLSSALGWGGTIAGLSIALLAPVLAQRADAAGRRKFWLLVYSGALIVSMFLLFFVEADPKYFLLGVILITLGTVFSEFAGVNYNAMITQISTPKTVGKTSGLGWGLGYIGGILALVIVVVLNQFKWFGMDVSNGLAYRLIALGCAVWAILFMIPMVMNVPETPRRKTTREGNWFVGFAKSYGDLGRHIRRIWRDDRPTFWFLLASAVYRDGLSGVFTFGAVIAAKVYGFSNNEVIIFGIAANLVAGIGTIIAGRLDDIFGPRAVIVGALTMLLGAGLLVFFLHDAGSIVFWICGMVLSSLVGPVQAASRSLLARLTPAGREGEIFGLYATTGRAASFMAAALWAIFTAAFGAIYWGILGIMIVIGVGLVLMLMVKMPPMGLRAASGRATSVG